MRQLAAAAVLITLAGCGWFERMPDPAPEAGERVLARGEGWTCSLRLIDNGICEDIRDAAGAGSSSCQGREPGRMAELGQSAVVSVVVEAVETYDVDGEVIELITLP